MGSGGEDAARAAGASTYLSDTSSLPPFSRYYVLRDVFK